MAPLDMHVSVRLGIAVNTLYVPLTHWGRVTHVCVSRLTITGSDNGLSPGRHQAIIWTNAVILLIGPLGTNFSEILIGIYTFSFKKMPFKMLSGKWWPFCLGLNVLMKMSHCGRTEFEGNKHVIIQFCVCYIPVCKQHDCECLCPKWLQCICVQSRSIK